MLRTALFSFAVALVAACGSSTSSTTASTTPAPASGDHCPMIEGTSVAVEDTATGAAVVFATTGDRAALRARVSAWAEKHNQHHGAMGPLPTGDEPAGAGHEHHHDAAAPAGGDHAGHAMHGEHAGHAMHGEHAGHGEHAMHGGDGPAAMITTHSRVEVADTEQGVRATFVTFPDQVGALQAEVRMHAEHLASAGCGAH